MVVCKNGESPEREKLKVSGSSKAVNCLRKAIYFFLAFLGFLVSFLRALFPLAMIDLRVESRCSGSSRDGQCVGCSFSHWVIYHPVVK
jgi:hypothetical protein